QRPAARGGLEAISASTARGLWIAAVGALGADLLEQANGGGNGGANGHGRVILHTHCGEEPGGGFGVAGWSGRALPTCGPGVYSGRERGLETRGLAGERAQRDLLSRARLRRLRR